MTSLIYRPALAAPDDVVSAFAPSRVAPSAAELTQELAAALDRAVAQH